MSFKLKSAVWAHLAATLCNSESSVTLHEQNLCIYLCYQQFHSLSNDDLTLSRNSLTQWFLHANLLTTFQINNYSQIFKLVISVFCLDYNPWHYHKKLLNFANCFHLHTIKFLAKFDSFFAPNVSILYHSAVANHKLKCPENLEYNLCCQPK